MVLPAFSGRGREAVAAAQSCSGLWLENPSTASATMMRRELFDGGPFAVSVFRYDDQLGVRNNDIHPDNPITLSKLHPADTPGTSAHRPDLFFIETHRLGVGCHHDDIILA